jgi:hypothetical protein
MALSEAQLLDIFGDDLNSVLASLDNLPPQVEEMLLNIVDQMSFDVQIFNTNIEKTVSTMMANGLSDEAIETILATDMKEGGRIFGELRNNTKASIAFGIGQASRLGQYENYDLDKGQLAWVTVGGHRVCPDCEGRTGQQMTFAEWESEGLPGSGWSVCQGYCYCVLDPTGEIKTKINVGPLEQIPR